jgi:prepilin-type N-terminal cleavage/methylation domain-containing protein
VLRYRKIGKRGFTLTELLVVLAIGIVLSAFAIPAISNLGLFAGTS